MRSMWPFLGLAGVSALALACGRIGFEKVALNEGGESGGRGGSAAAGSTGQAEDAATGDASSLEPTSDAAPTQDVIARDADTAPRDAAGSSAPLCERDGLWRCWNFDERPFTPGGLPVPNARVEEGHHTSPPAALRISTPARRQGGYHFIYPVSNNGHRGPLYVRANVRLSAGARFGDWLVLFQLVGTGRADGSFDKISLDLDEGELVEVTLGKAGVSVSTPGPRASLPRDRWFCLELEVDMKSAGGAIRAYQDDVLVARMDNVDTVLAGGLQAIAIGGLGGPEGDAMELRLDDVAIAPFRLGCD